MTQTLHIKVEGSPSSGRSTFLHKLMDLLVAAGYLIARDEENPHAIDVSWEWAAEPPLALPENEQHEHCGCSQCCYCGEFV